MNWNKNCNMIERSRFSTLSHISASDAKTSKKTILEYLPFRDPNDYNSKEINKRTTENNSPTYDSSGNPLLDFFFEALPTISKAELFTLFNHAWLQDNSKATKLLFHLRDVRVGKGEQKLFYELIVWLRHYHPNTLHANLRLFPRFGYYKDLLYFIARDCEGEMIHQQNEDKEKERQKLHSENVSRRSQKKLESSYCWFMLRYVQISSTYCL